MSNSFFDTSSYLKSEKNKSPFSLGNTSSLFDFSKYNKNDSVLGLGSNNENKIEQDEDKGKSFLDNFKEGALGYFKDAQKGKSDTDKYLDFLKETRGMAQGGQFGSGTGGFSQEVAEGLTTYVPPSSQQMFIPGQEGKPGFFGRMAGQVLGGAAGAVGSGLGQAFIGALCDIRAKEDIAPLSKINIEINDDLSECAYFVKDLQSGMFG